jgi:ABC-type uncharacterized transport system permease subunit
MTDPRSRLTLPPLLVRPSGGRRRADRLAEAAIAFSALATVSPLDSIRTLSATIAAELAEVVVGSPHYATLFFIGSLLFAITFVLNMAAGLMVERMRRRLAGA